MFVSSWGQAYTPCFMTLLSHKTFTHQWCIYSGYRHKTPGKRGPTLLLSRVGMLCFLSLPEQHPGHILLPWLRMDMDKAYIELLTLGGRFAWTLRKLKKWETVPIQLNTAELSTHNMLSVTDVLFSQSLYKNGSYVALQQYCKTH